MIKKQGDKSWMIMEDDDQDSSSSSSPSLGDSRISNESSSSSDMVDDDASSASCSSPPTSSTSGPLYELSELMAQLPIKRGLSKYFQGKSQSFSSLSKLKSIEDLVKKQTPYRSKKMTAKSFGFGLDSYMLHTLPRATISKKVSRSSYSSLFSQGRISSRPPQVPLQNNF